MARWLRGDAEDGVATVTFDRPPVNAVDLDALGLLKRCVYTGWGRPLAEGLEIERTAVFELLETRDAAEGLAAFLEKRSPRFTGC